MSKFTTTFLISFLLSFSFGLSAFAQKQNSNYMYASAYRNEIEASTTYGEFVSANSASALKLSGSYRYMFAKSMQAGFTVDLLVTSGNGNNNSYTGLWGNFAYDFDQSWNNRESYFAEVAAGMVDTALAGSTVVTSTLKSEKKFSYALFLGKYIPIWERVKLSPKIGMKKIGDLDAQVYAIPLNIVIGF